MWFGVIWIPLFFPSRRPIQVFSNLLIIYSVELMSYLLLIKRCLWDRCAYTDILVFGVLRLHVPHAHPRIYPWLEDGQKWSFLCFFLTFASLQLPLLFCKTYIVDACVKCIYFTINLSFHLSGSSRALLTTQFQTHIICDHRCLYPSSVEGTLCLPHALPLLLTNMRKNFTIAPLTPP